MLNSDTVAPYVFSWNNAGAGGHTLTARAYDDRGAITTSAAVTVSVNSNAAPVANNQRLSVLRGTSVNVTLSATDSDNDSLAYQITQQPQGGSISGSAPNIIYTANSSFVGTDIIKFKVNDGQRDSQVAVITIDVTASSNTGAVSNFINSSITLDGNESDWSGVERFAQDPNDVAGHIDWRDAAFAHNNQSFYINIRNHGNIDPNSNSGSYLAWGWQIFIDSDKNTNTGFKIGALGADFIIEGNQLHKYLGTGSNWNWDNFSSIESQYSGSVAELSFPRSLIGNPDSIRVVFSGNSASYGGTGTDLYPDSQNTQYFEYEFSGGATGGNHRPVANAKNVNTTIGTSINIILTGSDQDNDSLNFSVISNTSNGAISGTAPNLIYTPNSGFSGEDTFIFTVNDGVETSDPASVKINITNTQDNAYSNLVNSINVDGNAADWSILTAFSPDTNDVSGSNNFIDWQSAAIAHNSSQLYFLYENHGAVDTSSNSGDFINWGWQVYLDVDGNSSTGYQIGDLGADYIVEGTNLQTYTGSGSDWSWGNFTPVNVKYNGNVVELNFARNLINNPSTLRALFVGNNAVTNGDNSDYYPNDLSGFKYQLSGSTQTTSNRPVANVLSLSVSQNGSRSFDLSADDIDNNPLEYRLVSGPSNGKLTNFNPNGSAISYSPVANFVGEDNIRYVVNDGTFDSSVQTVTFKVTADNTNQTTSESGGGSLNMFGMILLFLIWLLNLFRYQSFREKIH